MIQLKAGVKLTDMKPQMVLAATIVDCIYRKYVYEICVITSANDSTHSEKSLHYSGNALDFRTKTIGPLKATIVAEIKAALGPDFDVILEGLGTDNEHLHVEYDPK